MELVWVVGCFVFVVESLTLSPDFSVSKLGSCWALVSELCY